MMATIVDEQFLPALRFRRGGYECEFLETVPDSFKCPQCNLPFRDPHYVKCCGMTFCQICLERIQEANLPCPNPDCNKRGFASKLDETLEFKISLLPVKCSNSSKGCTWFGELSELDNHEREKCEWTSMQCCCGRRFLRRNWQLHKEHDCRQVQLPDPSTYDVIAETAENTNAEIAQLKYEIIEVRKHMTMQMAAERERHLLEINELKAKNKASALKKNLGGTFPAVVCPPCEFVMSSYSQYKRYGSAWFSPPFYTAPSGYKMCLKVFPNGCCRKSHGHLSVGLDLIEGEFDDTLKWPFQGQIYIQLRMVSNEKSSSTEYDSSYQEELQDKESANGILFADHGSVGTLLIYSSTVKNFCYKDSLKFVVDKIVSTHC